MAFFFETWQLGILIDKLLVASFFKHFLAKTTENHFSNKILVAFFFENWQLGISTDKILVAFFFLKIGS